MLEIDLTGRRALVAGVADDAGFGFAIAKALAEAGASVCVGTWPPALNIFLNLLERGKMDESRTLSSGSLLTFEKVYPLDAVYDTYDAIPEDVRTSKRYKDIGDCSIGGVAARLVQDFGDKPLDIVVHSLANGPEVKKALIDVSREGYLAAMSASAYSLISMVSRFGPIMRPGGSFVSLTYLASERVIPGLRRRHVVGEGGARERHENAGIRSRPAVWLPREYDLRRPARVARGERDRDHREDGRVRGGERAAHREAHRSGSGARGGVSLVAAGERHHGKHDVRRQGLSRHGNGRAARVEFSSLSRSVYATGPFDSISLRPAAFNIVLMRGRFALIVDRSFVRSLFSSTVNTFSTS